MKIRKLFKAIVATAAVAIAAMTFSGVAQASTTMNVRPWMYDMTKSKSEIKEDVSNLSYFVGSSKATAEDFSLFSGVTGKLTIEFQENSSRFAYTMSDWCWDTYMNDNTYEQIKDAMEEQYSASRDVTSTFKDEGFDEVILFKAGPFRPGTYDTDWTLNGVKIEQAKSRDELETWNHCVLLIKNDVHVAVEYLPIGEYTSHTVHWTDGPFE